MEQLKDVTAKEWLTKHINWEGAERPLTLENFLPPIFDNYIIVLWTPGLIDNFPFEKIIQPPDTINQTNVNVAVWQQFNIFLNEDNDEAYRQTTFAELASLLSKSYDKQIINSLPWETKGIKTLFKQTRQRFQKIISALSPNDELNLFVADFYRWFNVYQLLPCDEEVVYKITLEEFLNFMDKTFYDANLYLYPDDKSWCLINMEDLGYNILAYNNNVGDKIAKLNLADTFKIKSDEIFFN